jgi:hypothetical protein
VQDVTQDEYSRLVVQLFAEEIVLCKLLETTIRA